MTSPHNDELFLAIGRLEGKMDALLSMQQYQQDQLKDHDSRIRSLEHSRGYVMGWSASIGALTSAIITFIIKSF